jgi:hypothetical protein
VTTPTRTDKPSRGELNFVLIFNAIIDVICQCVLVSTPHVSHLVDVLVLLPTIVFTSMVIGAILVLRERQ